MKKPNGWRKSRYRFDVFVDVPKGKDYCYVTTKVYEVKPKKDGKPAKTMFLFELPSNDINIIEKVRQRKGRKVNDICQAISELRTETQKGRY